MIFKLTSKGFKASVKTYEYVQRRLKKTAQLLPHLDSDLSQLNILIRKHTSKYSPKRHYHHAYTNFTNRKSSMALFEGSIDLKLPVKKLYVQFKGKNIAECLHVGMNRIQKEVKKYKDLHFKSQSEYPNHNSIRKSINYG